ncbi:MAG TPA: bifunctional phosphoribosyl-AMP cyclohydrolase/phosphoribosyl-ATP diphosphatase HisIE [Candidatus Limnocylindria bacterium]|nr:bifunctional phosphoribosyl-AMP cyclohydrolase/phosphoribosyl-ATP diphosphatase HisIE [Candidatus Limnocylindria bacterium]
MAWLNERRARPDRGLLPVVVQDADDGVVLMLAWANEEALAATEHTGEAHFWSRSRNELWRKGATSGNVMKVVDLAADCDGDAVLYRVRPRGPACHSGAESCFAVKGDESGTFTMRRLARIVEARRSAEPKGSYTARLLAGGPRRAGEKVVEEAGELLSAALAGSDDEVRSEAADVLYHVLVLLAARGISLEEVEQRLGERRQR